MSDARKPHPKNAPGPFYIVNGCCMTCMAPHVGAPNLMGFDDVEGHCFVRQQPKTDDEIYRAIRAVGSSEVQCLRYGGNDPDILRRLIEFGESEACDVSLLRTSAPILRNHVTFAAGFANDPWEVALALRHYILSNNAEYKKFKVTHPKRKGKVVRLAYSWYEDHYYTLNVELGEPATDRFLVHHSPIWEAGSVAVSLMIDDWLRSDSGFSDFRWFTSDQWERAGDQWQERPY
jgi:hypothetical protein